MTVQFRKSIPFAKLLKDTSNYETTPGQNLGDYGFQKLSKLWALNLQIPDKCLIDAVIGGITDENIARTVRSVHHTDANTLYAYLNTMGNMPNKTYTPNTSHFVGDCRKPRLECTKCNKLGHTQDDGSDEEFTNTSPDLKEEASNVSLNLLPTKSRQ
ncbi:hypothetical protein NQ314_011314 [Rhamnusium bicolor]|uniref:Uncharacterized protein n=1 Tax=Rhamnusium bicolor TaxID=1586634 RepID=A0AAV8XJS1_9CUCU|nr:hypothetical protein NQ314_011314 [Rhamnusium bicolor]